MKRLTSSLLALVVVALLAACTPAVGGLGTLNPGSSSPDASLPPASADATPGTPSASPPVSTPASAAPSAPPASSAPSSPASRPPASSAPSVPTAAPSANPTQPAGTTIVRVYFHLGGDETTEGLVAVLREVPKTQAVGRAALEALIAGPRGMETADGAGISTAVPSGTRLLGLSIEAGTATVDLSGAFESGGGSMASLTKLGQVVYTLTQFPTVERVVFRIDGRNVTVFGSEGIVLEGPQTRADYADLLPAVWVDRPAWGASLLNPARISGTADVFEAQFLVAILDNDGRPILDEPVMASCGTGCRGTFDVTLDYDVADGQWGALRTYTRSAADGSVESVRDYPVWLTPRD